MTGFCLNSGGTCSLLLNRIAEAPGGNRLSWQFVRQSSPRSTAGNGLYHPERPAQGFALLWRRMASGD